MSSLQMYEKVPQSEQNNSVLWRTMRDGMAAWMLFVQEEKWVFIHNVITIIYSCSDFLYSYSNYFSYSLAPFYYSPFFIFPHFLEFSFSSFYSSISTDFRLSIYFLRTLFVVNTLEFILCKLFIPYSQIPLSLYSFRTYSFQPPCSRQSSTFSCTLFMSLCFTFLTL